jgi:hypothetical protein
VGQREGAAKDWFAMHSPNPRPPCDWRYCMLESAAEDARENIFFYANAAVTRQ